MKLPVTRTCKPCAGRICVAVVTLVMTHMAFAASDLQPCTPDDSGYLKRAYRLMRDAQRYPLEPFVFMGSSMIQPRDIGIGLTKKSGRQYLVRLEFDQRLLEFTPVETAPDTYTYKEGTYAKVRALVTMVPVSSTLAKEFRSTLNELQGPLKQEPLTIVAEDGTVPEEIVLEGGPVHRLMLEKGRCIETAIRHETVGLKFVRLNYFFARQLQSWTRQGAARFEAEALSLLSELKSLNRTMESARGH